MKTRRITKDDIDIAVSKIAHHSARIDNYVFITTEPVNQEVTEYAAGMYEKIDGIEVAILDCTSFLRHFLHLFYRVRMHFLESYLAT